MAAKRAFPKAKSGNVFGKTRRPAKMLRASLYARVSTNDQQTLAMQSRAMREYAARRGWAIALQVREVNSAAARREAREKLLEAARRREILRERARAGLAHARENGKRLGRQATAALHATEIRKLYRDGVSKSEIAR